MLRIGLETGCLHYRPDLAGTPTRHDRHLVWAAPVCPSTPRQRKEPTTLRTLALALALAGCTRTADTACTAFVPITYSATGDTAQTVLQVRQHNAAWKALCG